MKILLTQISLWSFLLMGMLTPLCGQNQESIYLIEEDIMPASIILPFHDADNVQIGTYYYTGNNLDSTIFHNSRYKKTKVLFDMPAYEGGFDSLLIFFEEEFQKTEKKDSTLNAMALVYILLENNKITDIRIGERIAYDNKRFNYDKMIKDILYRTQDNWIIKPQEENLPVLFVYLFPLRYY